MPTSFRVAEGHTTLLLDALRISIVNLVPVVFTAAHPVLYSQLVLVMLVSIASRELMFHLQQPSTAILGLDLSVPLDIFAGINQVFLHLVLPGLTLLP